MPSTSPMALTLFLACILSAASPLTRRAAPDNTVTIQSASSFCLVVPREPGTNIGDSERPGGTTSYCTPAARYSEAQGELSSDFWRDVAFLKGQSPSGARFAQLTGCINADVLDRINSDDDGGQYDSSGGADGQGNPAGSVCTGYSHYVELLEPRGERACIKCCDDPADCPTENDTMGCPAVIPGNYFNCG